MNRPSEKKLVKRFRRVLERRIQPDEGKTVIAITPANNLVVWCINGLDAPGVMEKGDEVRIVHNGKTLEIWQSRARP